MNNIQYKNEIQNLIESFDDDQISEVLDFVKFIKYRKFFDLTLDMLESNNLNSDQLDSNETANNRKLFRVA